MGKYAGTFFALRLWGQGRHFLFLVLSSAQKGQPGFDSRLPIFLLVLRCGHKFASPGLLEQPATELV
jgi:hypothetical protein